MSDILNNLMSIARSGEAYEWAKWEEDFVEPMTTQTLCDVRRHIERIFGEKKFSDLQIVDAIVSAGGRITHRPESDVLDYCLVNLERVETILAQEIANNL